MSTANDIKNDKNIDKNNDKNINGAYDVYILSSDERFARMLLLTLEDEKISACIVKALPKKKVCTVIDIDSIKNLTRKDAITVSKDKRKSPTLQRPFDTAEFVRTVKNRMVTNEEDPNDFKMIDGVLFYGNSEIRLSETELGIFSLLYENRGQTVTNEELVNAVWNGVDKGNSIAVYINYLRKKLDFRFGKRFITTVRGKGYILSADIM